MQLVMFVLILQIDALEFTRKNALREKCFYKTLHTITHAHTYIYKHTKDQE